MDNIVDYLVVLFFVISFLASIFKKKKTQQKNMNEKMKVTTRSIQKEVPSKRTNNPFEDFFQSINEEMGKTKAESAHSEVDEYYEDALKKSAEANEAQQNNYQQKEFIEPLLKKNSNIKDSLSMKSYHESVKETKDKHESKKAKDIRISLKQNNSIKNFIIMNEILGKPKALQK